jgi:uncharacterized protein involved in exopolysaccharide biosynthesis
MSGDDKNPRDPVRARRGRNIALGLFLGFLVVLFFVMTLVRLGEHS